MGLKDKNWLFLAVTLILISFVSADYPFPDGATSPYDGTVNYPTDSFGIQAGCPNDNIIFKLSGSNNAHAALFSETSTSYNKNSCLTFDSGREYNLFKQTGLEDKDNVVLRLSGNSNAHAEKIGLDTGGYINVTFGEQICRYVDPDGNVQTDECNGLDEACVGAISGNTNAHVSDCSSADTNGYDKICCKPRCSIKVYQVTGDGKEIRSVYWYRNGNPFANSASLNNIVQLQIEGDGYCDSKELNFGVYKTDTNDELVTLGNGEFSASDIFSQTNTDGNLISCTNGVCRMRFNSDNKIFLSLNLINEIFSKDKQYYFSFLINGANYYSNLLTVRETITTGCGNNIIESNEGEVCEPGITENIPSCNELGFDGDGMENLNVGCTTSCRFDTSMCTCDPASTACSATGICNDDPDILNPGEECDDDSIAIGGISCNTINSLWTGQLSCNSQCKFDTGLCGGYCGNGIREDISYNTDGVPREPELCDGNDVPITCSSLGYSGGVIGCSGSCTFDTTRCVCDSSTTTCRSCDNPSGCGICGDDVLDFSNNEQCDGSVPSGLDCKSISTSWEGDLVCNNDCTLNIDACVGTCLNGRLDDNEVCDPTALSTPSNPNPRINECGQLGFKEGKYITCTNECELDTTRCSCPDDDPDCKDTDGICDGTTLDPGEECDDESLENNNLDKCSDIVPSWRGDLSCNLDTCKIDFSDCEAVETRECKKCDDCNTFFGNCGQEQCVNFCGLDEGGCYMDTFGTDECTSCDEVTSCDDYDTEEDCNAHREEGLPGGRCIGYALTSSGQVADCKWENNKCEENKACVWQCPDLNTAYGECQADDFRYPKAGATPRCTSNSLDCGVNGVIYLPEKVKCGKYSEEKAFSVFDNWNLILTILLLIGYYFVRKRKV